MVRSCRGVSRSDLEALAHIRSIAAGLRGLRVVHINATADGGRVAEILRSLIPLLENGAVEILVPSNS